jgi:hypothetical protein
MDCSGKGSLKMNTKLFFPVLLLAAAVAPGALAAGDDSETNVSHQKWSIAGYSRGAVTIHKCSTGAAVVQADPKQTLLDYDSLMVAINRNSRPLALPLAKPSHVVNSAASRQLR